MCFWVHFPFKGLCPKSVVMGAWGFVLPIDCKVLPHPRGQRSGGSGVTWNSFCRAGTRLAPRYSAWLAAASDTSLVGDAKMSGDGSAGRPAFRP